LILPDFFHIFSSDRKFETRSGEQKSCENFLQFPPWMVWLIGLFVDWYGWV